MINTVGEPTIQGAAVAGIQGIGVSTPKAAAVAAATAGLRILLHIPNGGILANGAKSIIVAAIGPPALTGGPLGIAMRVLAPIPKVQVIVAPVQTHKLIVEMGVKCMV